MHQTTYTFLNKIQSIEEALDLARKVMQTSYPLALWRLPQSDEINILIDLTSGENQIETELEKIHEGFVINSYGDSHPVKPLVLSGDIHITIPNGHVVEFNIKPTLTASQIEQFGVALAKAKSKKLKKAQSYSCPRYQDMIRKAVSELGKDQFHKVVLSRHQDFEVPEDFDPIAVFEKLTCTYPNAFCHLSSTQTYGVWLGATPEKLIAIDDNRYFSTEALAGTQLLKDGQSLSEIAWTEKEIEEQAMVSRYIISCLKKIRLREFDEIGPKTSKAGGLVHLKTEFKIDMEVTNSPMLGSTMMELLHPTSAVCGTPQEQAQAFITAHEGYDRELYAGFLGPVGFGGKSRLYVNLRCIQVFDKQIRVYAGAGITTDSSPELEFAETQNKMQTMLKVLQL